MNPRGIAQGIGILPRGPTKSLETELSGAMPSIDYDDDYEGDDDLTPDPRKPVQPIFGWCTGCGQALVLRSDCGLCAACCEKCKLDQGPPDPPPEQIPHMPVHVSHYCADCRRKRIKLPRERLCLKCAKKRLPPDHPSLLALEAPPPRCVECTKPLPPFLAEAEFPGKPLPPEEVDGRPVLKVVRRHRFHDKAVAGVRYMVWLGDWGVSGEGFFCGQACAAKYGVRAIQKASGLEPQRRRDMTLKEIRGRAEHPSGFRVDFRDPKKPIYRVQVRADMDAPVSWVDIDDEDVQLPWGNWEEGWRE